MISQQPSSEEESYFSATLGDLMQEQDVNQEDVSERSDISQGLLSSYLNNQSRPKQEGLTRLCKAFGTGGTRLAIAFLRDEVPPHLKNKIQISQKGGKGVEASASTLDLKEMPPKVRKFLEDAARVCEQRPKVLDALQRLLDLIGSE
jgi:transcriptional regulator with XRE-family HTH domain